jgi:hypothetical protein
VKPDALPKTYTRRLSSFGKLPYFSPDLIAYR